MEKKGMNQKVVGAIVGIVIVAAGSFYAGTLYGKSATPARGQFAAGGMFTRGAGSMNGGLRSGMGGGLTAGQILSKDASSITIKMQDGSSKIVLVNDSTQVMKSAQGTLDDLSTGTNVVVTGSTNSDGSVTAQSVQIRPAQP